ncbi:MAG: Spx/MgsR family RNA polymerase-binding regulatory protein [Xanthomonadales bacterium]|jgi:Spx/MgsR family transcriptional regulator|nr:Spx/MgsR family RNA polymerase-binding regulatory protein [Xanthomonadales bacterium]
MQNENSTLHVYGIRNCDTVRAALKWLDGRNLPHVFHDFRREALDERELRRWLASPHGEALVNRRSATWRKLDEAEKQRADSDPAQLLLEQPTLIKRPVITDGAEVLCVGFTAACREAFA